MSLAKFDRARHAKIQRVQPERRPEMPSPQTLSA
jgi:hypothetical protein